MYYPEEIVEEVRSRNDIVDVISGYVKLQKKGSNYFGLCPFHNEKSPSFSVSPQKQMYYCFGCGAGGNVITFLMEYESYTFPEALKILADRAGVKLPEVEDSKEEGRKDLEHLKVDERDVVVALSASGRTPYCIGALEYAREAGACCVGLSCNRPAELSAYSDIAIEVDAGPEILTGSTRLKAGTAEKMILNMISTASMVGIGKVYGNLMVDMRATNLKLVERAKRIVSMACSCTEEAAQAALLEADGGIKAAIVMILAGITAKEAKERLEIHKGFVRKCLDGAHGRA